MSKDNVELEKNYKQVYDKEFNYKLASYHKRFFSLLLDWMITFVTFYILVHIYAYFIDVNINDKAISNSISLIYSFLFLVYLWFTWIINEGQSIGQKILNIKIIYQETKEPLSVKGASLRILGWLASNIMFGLGFLLMFFNKDRKGLHDYTSKTIVIDISRKELSKKS